MKMKKQRKNISVRCGIRTHAHIRGPEHSSFHKEGNNLESGALDHSANLTYFMCT